MNVERRWEIVEMMIFEKKLHRFGVSFDNNTVIQLTLAHLDATSHQKAHDVFVIKIASLKYQYDYRRCDRAIDHDCEIKAIQ